MLVRFKCKTHYFKYDDRFAIYMGIYEYYKYEWLEEQDTITNKPILGKKPMIHASDDCLDRNFCELIYYYETMGVEISSLGQPGKLGGDQY